MTAPQSVNQQIPQLNHPSKPQVVGVSTGRNQHERRYMDTFWDIHKSARFPRGRPWCGPREIAANHELMHDDGFVIGDLMQGEYVEHEDGSIDRLATLSATWTAPWRPYAKYFRFNYKRKLISFEYAKMRADEQRSLDEYYQAAAILGAQLNVRVDYGVMPSFQITAKLGNPTKGLKIAEAAMAGDPWLLGHLDEPNPELADLLGFNARGMKITSYIPEPVAVITPQQVLQTPTPELMALLERLTDTVAQQGKVLAAMQTEKAKAKAKGAQMRDAKARKASATTVNPAGENAA